MSVLFSRFRDCLSGQPTRSELKRAAILEAAVDEFQRQGLRDTSMDRIAASAEVSKRTVYNHFDSKEALFRAIVAEMLHEQGASVHARYDRDRSLEEQLVELAFQEIDLLQDDAFIGMARVLLAESFSTPDLARDAFGDAEKAVQPLNQWISAAIEDGRLDIDDPQLAAAQLKSLLKGLLFWPVVTGYKKRPSKKETESIVVGAVRMFLDHYSSR